MIYLLAAFLTLVIVGVFHEEIFDFLYDLYTFGEDEE